jgi:hypothetical protein
MGPAKNNVIFKYVHFDGYHLGKFLEIAHVGRRDRSVCSDRRK